MRITPLPLLGFCLLAAPAAGQDHSVALDAVATFYGDNTEFSNPFREGETLIGTFATVAVSARLSDHLTLRGGAFGHQRFGSNERFDEVRPVITLVIGGPRSRLLLGTLETIRRIDGAGPDRTGLHGLLPPVQRETLSFDRPWEAGMQWTIDTARIKQEAWLNWQRKETPYRREQFDTGLTSRIRLRESLAVRGDIHLVHQGGQMSNVGPVADSLAAGLGIEAGAAVGPIDRVSLEGLALLSRHVPDRAGTGESRTGFGAFIRAAAQEGGWRLHGILWRADDFIKVEGDPHYHSLRRDGTHYRSLRDYAEAGLTRTFDLAPDSWIEASVRWHRVENDYEYSFRVIAVARLHLLLR